MSASVKPFERVLIANRGEIACRIAATLQRLGITSIAVYSDADRDALHVHQADEAMRIGPAEAVHSYLSIEALMAAARQSNADALHPGYGFLSENAALADACREAGVVFIGPDARCLDAMGLKDSARRLMRDAGVPIVPGYDDAEQSAERLLDEARAIGFPVMIKARAGGGGKGMRRVESEAAFAAALDAARREASASFGDDRVLIEKYIERPRHIEVQVFGDRHGNVVHLFERDCSLQRRHQKVIEESPAPGMTAGVRQAMTDAAVTAARAIDYVGAGTVEFIVDGRGALRADGFWFMEMNTRLQVEHPVTEAVTGIDLVEWQLRVAAGEPIPLDQRDIQLSGHAMEARLYAEDASAGFLPATGRLQHLYWSPGVRIDAGVRAGDEVSPHYDPLLAKLIASGCDREFARRQLVGALKTTEILGTVTNREFLWRLLEHEDVRKASLHTNLIEDVGSDTWLGSETRLGAIAAVLQLGWPREVPNAASDPTADATPVDARPAVVSPPVAEQLGLWQLWGTVERQIELHSGSEPRAYRVQRLSTDRWRVTVGSSPGNPGASGPVDTALSLEFSMALPRANPGKGVVVLDGTRWPLTVWCGQDSSSAELGIWVQLDGRTARFCRPVTDLAAASAGEASLKAPMPGRIIELCVKAGDTIDAGQRLITLEAMKMEHSLAAEFPGQVTSVEVAKGAQVTRGQVLLIVES